MTPAPKPRRISREEAIADLTWAAIDAEAANVDPKWIAALRMGIRALKREQKAADAKKKETKR